MSEQAKKRKRIALSCDNCRRKKTKCDRGLPCSNCVKLSISHTCSYSSPSHINHNRSNEVQPQIKEENLSIQQELVYLKGRLRQLESSVTTNTDAIQLSVEPFDGTQQLRQGQVLVDSNNVIMDRNKDLLIGILPHRKEEAQINLHFTDETSNRLTKPPLPFMHLSKRDPGVKLFWSFENSPRYAEYTFKDIFFSSRRKDKRLDAYKQMAKEKFGNKYIKELEDGYSLSEVKASISNHGKSVGIVFHPIDMKLFTLNQKILSLIPNQKIISRFLNAFFEYLYPFFPVLDESSFRSDLSRIMGAADEFSGRITEIKMEKKSDYAILATFFYIIRLTSLIWFTNDIETNYQFLSDNSPSSEKEREMIMESPIPLDLIDVAEECIKLFNLFKVQDLTVLQALIFGRAYNKFAPEMGDKFTGPETQVSDGIVIQVAISLRLNRDPDFYLEANVTDKVKNLKRKIWHYLVGLDVEDTLMFGTTLTIDSKSNYDTKLPFYKEGASNIVDTELEKDVLKSIVLSRPIIYTMSLLATTVSNIKAKVDVTQFLEELQDMELLCSRIFGRLKSLISEDLMSSESFRIKRIYYYLQLKLFLCQMYFFCHIYYSDLGERDLEQFYHKKVFTILFNELAELGQIDKNARNFGRAFTVMLTPLINSYNHILYMVCASFSVRLSATLREDLESEFEGSSKDLLQEILNMALACTKTTIKRMSIIANRYFFAWKINKAHLYGIKLMNEVPIYESNTSMTLKARLKYSKEQLRDFERLLRYYTVMFGIKVDGSVSSPLNDVSDSLNVLLPGSLNNIVKDSETVVNDLQTDNFWCQLRKICSEAEIEDCLNPDPSTKPGRINLNLGPTNVDETQFNYNNIQTQFDFFNDTAFFELFKVAKLD